MKTLKKRPPFDFVLEELADIVTDIKPMFGTFGLYRGEQILMALRKKEAHPYDNGMWLAIPNEHWANLKAEIKELRDIVMFGPGPTGWQVLGEDLPNFEEVCLRICDLIKNRDPRIGKTPKSKLPKQKAKAKAEKKAHRQAATNALKMRTLKKKAAKKMIKKVVKKKKIVKKAKTSLSKRK